MRIIIRKSNIRKSNFKNTEKYLHNLLVYFFNSLYLTNSLCQAALEHPYFPGIIFFSLLLLFILANLRILSLFVILKYLK